MKSKSILFLFGIFLIESVGAMDLFKKTEMHENAFNFEIQEDDLTDLGRMVKYGAFLEIKKAFDMVLGGEPCDFLRNKPLSFLEFLFLTRGKEESLISGIMAILSCQKEGQRVALIDLNAWERFSPLHAAAAYGYLDVFKRLIDLGADFNTKTIDGASVIHCVVGKYNEMLFPKQAVGRKSSLGRLPSGNFQLLAATGWKIKRSPPHGRGGDVGVLSPRTDSRINVLGLISRLEILKIIIEKVGPSIVLACDLSEKMPRDYDLDGSLTVFLDGCSEDIIQNKELYKKVYTCLMETLSASPKIESHLIFRASEEDNTDQE